MLGTYMYKKNEYQTPYDDWEKENMQNQYIQKEMQNYRSEALKKFESIVPHPQFTIDIALTTIYGYREGFKQAEAIIWKLNLDEIEILSVEENFESFSEIYMEQLERQYAEDRAI